jgi:hypothetical protein
VANRIALFLIFLSFFSEGEKIRIDFDVKVGNIIERVISKKNEYFRPVKSKEIYRVEGESAIFDSYRKYHGKNGTFYLLDLSRKGKYFDALSFDELLIECDAEKKEIALADREMYLKEENLPVGKNGGKILLSDFYNRLDLQRMKYVVVFTESPLKQLKAVFRRIKKPVSDCQKSMKNLETWAWHPESVEGQVLKECNIGAVYLQIGDAFQDTASRLKKDMPDLKIYALDGSPDDIDHYDRLEKKLNALPTDLLYGIQLDVEPYLLPEYFSRPQKVMIRYLKLLKRVSGWCRRNRLVFSVTVPFWFDSLEIEKRSLAMEIMQYADELVLMSYRSEPETVLEISRDFLRLGEIFHKRVSIGIELLPVEDEEHIRYRVASAGPCITERFFHLECLELEEKIRFRIPGDRFSFSSRPSRLRRLLRMRPLCRSFGTYVLHDYTTLKLFKPMIK